MVTKEKWTFFPHVHKILFHNFPNFFLFLSLKWKINFFSIFSDFQFQASGIQELQKKSSWYSWNWTLFFTYSFFLFWLCFTLKRQTAKKNFDPTSFMIQTNNKHSNVSLLLKYTFLWCVFIQIKSPLQTSINKATAFRGLPIKTNNFRSNGGIYRYLSLRRLVIGCPGFQIL